MVRFCQERSDEQKVISYSNMRYVAFTVTSLKPSLRSSRPSLQPSLHSSCPSLLAPSYLLSSPRGVKIINQYSVIDTHGTYKLGFMGRNHCRGLLHNLLPVWNVVVVALKDQLDVRIKHSGELGGS